MKNRTNSRRIDAWSRSEDRLLADTVLEYIRKGQTQLEAFYDVGRIIERSPNAVGYRWNCYVRQSESMRKKVKAAKREYLNREFYGPEERISRSIYEENKRLIKENAVLFDEVQSLQGRLKDYEFIEKIIIESTKGANRKDESG